MLQLLSFFIGSVISAPLCSYNEIVSTELLREIKVAEKLTGIDKDLIIAISYVESRFNNKAISKVGAIGIMQIYGYKGKRNLSNRQDNLIVGAEKLKWFIDTYGYKKGISRYNCGTKKACIQMKEVVHYTNTVTRLHRKFERCK